MDDSGSSCSLAERSVMEDFGSVARFGPDGQTMAVGLADGTVKLVLDVEPLRQGAHEGAPMRAFTDHTGPVNDLDFHPHERILVSASDDRTMRFYSYSNPGSVAARQCTDTHRCQSVSFHPAGDHLLVGTEHSALHLYDVNTFRCFLSAQPQDYHTAPVADARWSANGSMYASCAGADVKLWDGVSSRCVRTLADAHGGADVGRVAFGLGQQLLLTSGADASLRLWDVGTGKQLHALAVSTPTHFVPGCCFANHSRLVVGAADADGGWASWDARTGEAVQRSSGRGAAPLRCIASSPTQPMVAGCHEDATVSVWSA